MKTEEKTKRLLEMQEHPERYTEEEIRQLMADDECRQIYEQMVRATDALFAEATPTPQTLPTPVGAGLGAGSVILKIAAMFIGVLLLSGIAYATIHMVSHHQQSEAALTTDTTAVANSQLSTLNSQHPSDSIAQPRIFENVPLDEMVTEIAHYYNKVVDIKSEQAHELRLYYKWKPQDALDSVVEDLNHFDRVSLAIEDDKLIVKP